MGVKLEIYVVIKKEGEGCGPPSLKLRRLKGEGGGVLTSATRNRALGELGEAKSRSAGCWMLGAGCLVLGTFANN
jgi:hypothetical protein